MTKSEREFIKRWNGVLLVMKHNPFFFQPPYESIHLNLHAGGMASYWDCHVNIGQGAKGLFDANVIWLLRYGDIQMVMRLAKYDDADLLHRLWGIAILGGRCHERSDEIRAILNSLRRHCNHLIRRFAAEALQISRRVAQLRS